VTVVGSTYYAERSRLGRERFGSFVREGPVSDRYEYVSEGVRQPPTRPAGEARLADEEVVIGVEIGGEARAYRLEAMKNREQHVINDVVAGVPLTVTYCDLTDCARAFTDPASRGPLDVSLGGLKGDRMMIKVGDRFFLQDSLEPVDSDGAGPPFPYLPFPTMCTSWKSWREAHPHTDVYVWPTTSGPP
jgi:hypothetical protein